MIINYPDYYKKFNCIADKCPDTCCSRWQVVVDRETADYFKKLDKTFGDYVCSKMYEDEDGDIVFKNIHNHCPFLNENQLCQLHIEFGQEHTPDTCKMFPRFKNSFGGTAECGLSLSCPVAAELIVNRDSFKIESEFNDELPDINDIDADLFLSLKASRKKCVDYINRGELSKEKLLALAEYGRAVEKLADRGNFSEIGKLNIEDFQRLGNKSFSYQGIFNSFEYLTEKGEKLLKSYRDAHNFSLTQESKNILLYYIYRYFLQSVYDGDIYFHLAFCVFSTVVISSVAENSKLPLTEIGRIYSKEIEHSKDNIQIFCNNI